MGDVSVIPQPCLWVPRTKPIRFIEIHATRGKTTPEKQKQAALNWVLSPNNKSEHGDWGSSFSHVIGTDGSEGNVLRDDQAPTYSAGYGGPGSEWSIDEYGISYELAQSADQEPFTDACLRRAAREVAIDCGRYGIPVEFLWVRQQSGTVPTGLVRHDQCQNGIYLGKNDPGVQFNQQYFLSLVRAQMQPEEDDMSVANVAKYFRDIEQKMRAGTPLTAAEKDLWAWFNALTERTGRDKNWGIHPEGGGSVTIPEQTLEVK